MEDTIYNLSINFYLHLDWQETDLLSFTMIYSKSFIVIIRKSISSKLFFRVKYRHHKAIFK
jgi:hypothetical protein